MLPSQKRNANATEKLDFGYKDSKEALQKKLDLSALCLMCSCVAVMLHCTAVRAVTRGSFGKEDPQQPHMLGFVPWLCQQLQGMEPQGYWDVGVGGEKQAVSWLDVEERRCGSGPQQAEAAGQAALRLSWLRRIAVAVLAGSAFLWAEFRGDLVTLWAANRISLWLSLNGFHLLCRHALVLGKNPSSFLVLSKHSYCFPLLFTLIQ